MAVNRIIKFIICCSLVCFTIADVKHLPKEYLPPSTQQAIAKFGVVSDVLDLSKNEIVGNDLKMYNAEPFMKDTSNDPAYVNIPVSYNYFQAAYPNQGFPGQVYPHPVYPPQHVLPPQGFPRPGFPPSPIYISQGFPQGYSPQYLPGHGYTGQGFPGQGFPGQGFPGQGFPGQGFPGQGFPGQGFPGQAFPGQGLPGQVVFNPSMPVTGYPSYPVYFSGSEKLKTDNEGNNLRVRVINSDTQYDAANGGYLYKKPAVTI